MEMRKTTRNTPILLFLDRKNNKDNEHSTISGRNLLNGKITLPNFITAKCPHNHVKNFKT